MFIKQIRRVGLAVVAVGSIGFAGQAFAQNTPSGDTITNTATVNYTVNSVTQTPISANAAFTVDTDRPVQPDGRREVGVRPADEPCAGFHADQYQ